MDTFIRLFYEFISIFFNGIMTIFKGIYEGILQIFKIEEYKKILSTYESNFSTFEWILAIIAIIMLIVIVVSLFMLMIYGIRRLLNLRKHHVNNDDLLDEIDNLNKKVRELMKEKNELMAMKVSQLGLNPEGEETPEDEEKKEGEEEEPTEENEEEAGNIRFPKLVRIDEQCQNLKVKNYNNSFTLEELVDNLRCYAASQLRLYYDASLLRAFIAGIASSRLIILQGISGTGKTSLAYAWGKFVKNDSCIASVQPSWRDRTELLGYFNEFTKKFNESNVLEELYLATYDDNVHTIVLDEMNIARVEYYFAEMLSILEIPQRSEWVIELVTTVWPDDPKKLVNGKLVLPGNLWYMGTINNDDSTFMVADKVYDRAMPIDINNKINPFKCREQEAMNINASYLESLFNEAVEQRPVSKKTLDLVEQLDDYVIKHFRVAFGNRIMKQLKVFTSVYVACGGNEIEAVDYFLAQKVLRKFDQLNIALIYDEIDEFIKYLNTEVGKGKMKECIAFLERLKKSA